MAKSGTFSRIHRVNAQLTDQSGTEYFPALAPDGKSFVYAAEHKGNFDVFSQRVGGKNATSLTADSVANETQPAFSPDGERIAFRSEREPKGIYVMGATGENLRRGSDFGFHPLWSPDGTKLTGTFSAGSRAVGIYSFETNSFQQFAEVPASIPLMIPSWLPKSRNLGYANENNFF